MYQGNTAFTKKFSRPTFVGGIFVLLSVLDLKGAYHNLLSIK